MKLKKLLAFIIALAMVMSIAPAMSIVSFADEGAVAMVGEAEYDSLAQAVEAAGKAYEDEPVAVTLLADSDEDFTLNSGIVELVTGDCDYTGTVTVNGAVLITHCELENVVCTKKGANSDETKFGYTSLAPGAEMVNGAQVRIGEGATAEGKVAGEESGIRFITTVNQTDTLAGIACRFYDAEARAYAEGYQVGVKIMAADSDEEVIVPATLWQVEGEVFTTALTNLVENNYNRKFTATAYVEVGGIRFEDSSYTERSIYQVAAGILTGSETATEMSQALVNVLNAYVNQTGVRLTLSDPSADATLEARVGNGSGAYTGEAFFTVGDTAYRNGMYTVTLKAVGKSVINTKLFNEYVRINNNNSMVSPVTGIEDNGDGTYTVSFDYADMHNGSGVINEPVTLTNGNVTAYLPAGVSFSGSADKLKLVLTSIDDEKSEVEAGEGEELNSFDIHVNGVSENNIMPIVVTFKEVADKGLNRGNLKLYHVEDGKTLEMEQVDNFDDVTKHNQFAYNPLDGTIVAGLASFSEVALVAEEDKAWKGKIDLSWYNAEAEELTIANADQLAAFGAIVGGMAKDIKQDSFAGKTVKLVNDINLGDAENANDINKIFHPIGYYYTDDKNADGTTGDYYSTVNSFEGTFDGNGHTISNFYHNTWEIKGDYSGNYYSDGMGLFGYVAGGTVKNLTVDNFSSDGEFTPTGVIAAYAVNSTFENIALTNCNPRVYNTGNGGIIGIAGRENEAVENITLKNITVDNSNKISALWGSWDVACGGLVGMYRGNADANGKATEDTISFENCHVSAQIDVYNDVCGNYQYYAYRYAGMMIGSIRHNTTNTEGRTIPNMAGVSANGCTVNYGDWNDYYYCELVANSLASYTHDHQFSRLEQVKEVNGTTITYLDGTTGTVPASGRFNYVVETVDADTSTVKDVKCFHFVDGAVWNHETAGTEVVDGVTVPLEDKTCVYLPFHQLFTGYSWGVSSVGLKEYSGIVTNLDITEGDQEESVEKFAKKVEDGAEFTTGTTVTVGDLFEAVATEVELKTENIMVSVSAVGEDSDVTGVYTANEDWTKSTITFDGVGKAKIAIQDYYFCTPTTIEVEVTERVATEKFAKKFTNENFLYRVGNQNEVALGSLFKAADGVEIGTVDVDVVAVDSTGVTAKVREEETWSNRKITFEGTGIVKVTIKDDDNYCNPTELYLEVVNATNVTSATDATSKNIVLLNDCGFSSLKVSDGYTLYGNGFTMTCASDSAAKDRGYGFVTLENGTLDNIQIICPNFSHSILYDGNKTEGGNPTDGDGRYYNIKSAVIASGNSHVVNSKISGGRAAIYATAGNIVIDNSTIIGGAAANIHLGSANSLTLKDATLIQIPTQANVNDTTKTVMGFSVVTICDAGGNTTPITLEGDLIQYAWARADYEKYIPQAGTGLLTLDVVSYVLKKTNFVQSITYADDVTADSINLGFCYLPDSKAPNKPTVYDNRTNKATVPYDATDVNGSAYIYSITKEGTDASVTGQPASYIPDTQKNVIPDITFTDGNEYRVLEKEYNAQTDAWDYSLTIDLDQDSYALNFEDLLVTKYGKSFEYFVKDSDGNTIDKSQTISVETGTANYVISVIDNLFYNKNGELVEDKSENYEFVLALIGKESSKDAPMWSSNDNGTELATTMNASFEAGLCVASSYGGTWHGAAPALQNVYVRYYSTVNKAYKIINLATYTPEKSGTFDGTDTDCIITGPDFTVQLTGGQVHSSNKVYAMPVVCDDKLYFVASSSNGLVNSGNSARTIAVSYTFTDSFGNILTGSHTWSVAENKDEQYKYSDFCKGTLTPLTDGSGGCVTPETLITLADGSQVQVQNLKGDEELLVWNMETGKYDAAPIVFIDVDEAEEHEIIHLYFEDETDVEVIYEHGFFDITCGEYVYLDRNTAKEHIGHSFVMQDDIALNTWKTVKLTDVVLEKRVAKAYSPVTFEHLCYYTDGMLSMPGGIEGLFNIFEVDTSIMAYDAEKKIQDIETYGLYTYEEFEDIIPEIAYEAYNGDILKVAIGKGMLTWERIYELAERYVK